MHLLIFCVIFGAIVLNDQWKWAEIQLKKKIRWSVMICFIAETCKHFDRDTISLSDWSRTPSNDSLCFSGIYPGHDWSAHCELPDSLFPRSTALDAMLCTEKVWCSGPAWPLCQPTRTCPLRTAFCTVRRKQPQRLLQLTPLVETKAWNQFWKG